MSEREGDVEDEKEVDKERDGEGQIVERWERENESSSGRKDKAKEREQGDRGKDEIIERSFVVSHWVSDMSILYPLPGCASSFDSYKNPVYINRKPLILTQMQTPMWIFL